MHDLDRTLNEFEAEYALETDQYEGEGEWYGEYGGVLNETDEMALAAELLSVQNEEELEQFFGKIFQKAAGAARAFARSSTGQALGGILKDAAGKALPVVGAGIGGWIGGERGRGLGQQAGQWAKDRLGWELEGMDQEAEFEVARALVKTAAEAARTLSQAPGGAPPVAAAKQAAIQAAQQHAPQLVRVVAGAQPGAAAPAGGGGSSGRWVRRGSTITLFGV